MLRSSQRILKRYLAQEQDPFKDSEGRFKTKWEPNYSPPHHKNPMNSKLPAYPCKIEGKKPTKEQIFEYQLPHDVYQTDDRELLNIWSVNEDYFSVNQRWIKGPICIFPEAVFQWHVDKPENIQDHHLEIVKHVRPKVEYIIIGTGKLGKDILNEQIRFNFGLLGISVDYCPTFEACGSFNLCVDDRRRVAAFLFPVSQE